MEAREICEHGHQSNCCRSCKKQEVSAVASNDRVIKLRSKQEIKTEMKEVDKQIDEAEVKWGGTEKDQEILLPLYRKWKKLEEELRAL